MVMDHLTAALQQLRSSKARERKEGLELLRRVLEARSAVQLLDAHSDANPEKSRDASARGMRWDAVVQSAIAYSELEVAALQRRPPSGTTAAASSARRDFAEILRFVVRVADERGPRLLASVRQLMRHCASLLLSSDPVRSLALQDAVQLVREIFRTREYACALRAKDLVELVDGLCNGMRALSLQGKSSSHAAHAVYLATLYGDGDALSVAHAGRVLDIVMKSVCAHDTSEDDRTLLWMLRATTSLLLRDGMSVCDRARAALRELLRWSGMRWSKFRSLALHAEIIAVAAAASAQNLLDGKRAAVLVSQVFSTIASFPRASSAAADSRETDSTPRPQRAHGMTFLTGRSVAIGDGLLHEFRHERLSSILRRGGLAPEEERRLFQRAAFVVGQLPPPMRGECLCPIADSLSLASKVVEDGDGAVLLSFVPVLEAVQAVVVGAPWAAPAAFVVHCAQQLAMLAKSPPPAPLSSQHAHWDRAIGALAPADSLRSAHAREMEGVVRALALEGLLACALWLRWARTPGTSSGSSVVIRGLPGNNATSRIDSAGSQYAMGFVASQSARKYAENASSTTPGVSQGDTRSGPAQSDETRRAVRELETVLGATARLALDSIASRTPCTVREHLAMSEFVHASCVLNLVEPDLVCNAVTGALASATGDGRAGENSVPNARPVTSSMTEADVISCIAAMLVAIAMPGRDLARAFRSCDSLLHIGSVCHSVLFADAASSCPSDASTVVSAIALLARQTYSESATLRRRSLEIVHRWRPPTYEEALVVSLSSDASWSVAPASGNPLSPVELVGLAVEALRENVAVCGATDVRGEAVGTPLARLLALNADAWMSLRPGEIEHWAQETAPGRRAVVEEPAAHIYESRGLSDCSWAHIAIRLASSSPSNARQLSPPAVQAESQAEVSRLGRESRSLPEATPGSVSGDRGHVTPRVHSSKQEAVPSLRIPSRPHRLEDTMDSTRIADLRSFALASEHSVGVVSVVAAGIAYDRTLRVGRRSGDTDVTDTGTLALAQAILSRFYADDSLCSLFETYVRLERLCTLVILDACTSHDAVDGKGRGSDLCVLLWEALCDPDANFAANVVKKSVSLQQHNQDVQVTMGSGLSSDGSVPAKNKQAGAAAGTEPSSPIVARVHSVAPGARDGFQGMSVSRPAVVTDDDLDFDIRGSGSNSESHTPRSGMGELGPASDGLEHSYSRARAREAVRTAVLIVTAPLLSAPRLVAHSQSLVERVRVRGVSASPWLLVAMAAAGLSVPLRSGECYRSAAPLLSPGGAGSGWTVDDVGALRVYALERFCVFAHISMEEYKPAEDVEKDTVAERAYAFVAERLQEVLRGSARDLLQVAYLRALPSFLACKRDKFTFLIPSMLELIRSGEVWIQRVASVSLTKLFLVFSDVVRVMDDVEERLPSLLSDSGADELTSPGAGGNEDDNALGIGAAISSSIMARVGIARLCRTLEDRVLTALALAARRPASRPAAMRGVAALSAACGAKSAAAFVRERSQTACTAWLSAGFALPSFPLQFFGARSLGDAVQAHAPAFVNAFAAVGDLDGLDQLATSCEIEPSVFARLHIARIYAGILLAAARAERSGDQAAAVAMGELLRDKLGARYFENHTELARIVGRHMQAVLCAVLESMCAPGTLGTHSARYSPETIEKALEMLCALRESESVVALLRIGDRMESMVLHAYETYALAETRLERSRALGMLTLFLHVSGEMKFEAAVFRLTVHLLTTMARECAYLRHGAVAELRSLLDGAFAMMQDDDTDAIGLRENISRALHALTVVLNDASTPREVLRDAAETFAFVAASAPASCRPAVALCPDSCLPLQHSELADVLQRAKDAIVVARRDVSPRDVAVVCISSLERSTGLPREWALQALASTLRRNEQLLESASLVNSADGAMTADSRSSTHAHATCKLERIPTLLRRVAERSLSREERLALAACLAVALPPHGDPRVDTGAGGTADARADVHDAFLVLLTEHVIDRDIRVARMASGILKLALKLQAGTEALEDEQSGLDVDSRRVLYMYHAARRPRAAEELIANCTAVPPEQDSLWQPGQTATFAEWICNLAGSVLVHAVRDKLLALAAPLAAVREDVARVVLPFALADAIELNPQGVVATQFLQMLRSGIATTDAGPDDQGPYVRVALEVLSHLRSALARWYAGGDRAGRRLSAGSASASAPHGEDVNGVELLEYWDKVPHAALLVAAVAAGESHAGLLHAEEAMREQFDCLLARDRFCGCVEDLRDAQRSEVLRAMREVGEPDALYGVAASLWTQESQLLVAEHERQWADALGTYDAVALYTPDGGATADGRPGVEKGALGSIGRPEALSGIARSLQGLGQHAVLHSFARAHLSGRAEHRGALLEAAWETAWRKAHRPGEVWADVAQMLQSVRASFSASTLFHRWMYEIVRAGAGGDLTTMQEVADEARLAAVSGCVNVFCGNANALGQAVARLRIVDALCEHGESLAAGALPYGDQASTSLFALATPAAADAPMSRLCHGLQRFADVELLMSAKAAMSRAAGRTENARVLTLATAQAAVRQGHAQAALHALTGAAALASTTGTDLTADVMGRAALRVHCRLLWEQNRQDDAVRWLSSLAQTLRRVVESTTDRRTSITCSSGQKSSAEQFDVGSSPPPPLSSGSGSGSGSVRPRKRARRAAVKASSAISTMLSESPSELPVTPSPTRQRGSSDGTGSLPAADSAAAHEYASVLLELGQWLGETRSMPVERVLLDYLDEALRWSAPDQRANGHLCVARFCDNALTGLNERRESPEWAIHNQLRKHKAKELEDCRELYKAQSSHSARQETERHIRTLTKLVEQFEQEAAQLEAERLLYLSRALEGYAEAILRGCGDSLEAAFRLCAIWFAHAHDEDANRCIADRVQEFPTGAFLPLMYQISSRMASSTSTFQQTLRQLVYRVVVSFPERCLYTVFALSKGDHVPRDQRGQSRFVYDRDKVRAARDLLEELRNIPSVQPLIAEMEPLLDALIDLADHVVSPERARSSGEIPIGGRLGRVRALARVPVATARALWKPGVQTSLHADSLPRIARFHRSYTLAGGLNLPKIVTCVGTDGLQYRQLVKGRDDMRQDAVMEQAFGIMNVYLAQDAASRERCLRMRTYSVIPLSPCSGLLEWVENTMPVGVYLVGTVSAPHTGAHARYNPTEPTSFECRKLMQQPFHSDEERYQRFQDVCRRFHPVMHRFFLEHYHHPRAWFHRRTTYTHSVAVGSMIGYILGLGDRHSQNILIDKETAELVHIDLGVAFEQGKMLRSPELIPFRLTRDIIDGMGCTGYEGCFRRTCEIVLELLKKRKDAIMTVLEVFVHDPLFRWALDPLRANGIQRLDDDQDDILPSNSNRRSDHIPAVGNADAERALLRVRQKLQGYEGGELLSTKGQVNQLINDATNMRYLSRLFPGWAPWI